MPRVALDFPEDTFTFGTTLSVRFDDINVGGHLGNDRLVTLLGEARSQYLADLGLTEVGTPGIIVADLVVAFRAEARLRDRLCIQIGITERNKYGGHLAYRVVRESDGVLIAVAETGVLFYDYDRASVVTPPPAFLA